MVIRRLQGDSYLFGAFFVFIFEKIKKEETTMVIKKSTWVILSVFIIAVWLLGSVHQVMAETRKGKFFNHATKLEVFPIPDTEGHFVGTLVREGVNIFDDGELAWHKAVITFDNIKGKVSFSQYSTLTYQDGSTTTSYSKGT
jgi:hypothetical protein